MSATPEGAAVSLQYSYLMVTEVTVYRNGAYFGKFDTVPSGNTLTYSVGNTPMSTLNLVIDDPTGKWRGDPVMQGPLAPFVCVVQVSNGLIAQDGKQYMANQGTFFISQVDVEVDTNGVGSVVTLTGGDASYVLAASLLTDVFNVAAGSLAASVIQAVVEKQSPQLNQFNLATVDIPLVAQIFQPGDDPMTDLQGLAGQVGCVLYFDRNNVLTMRQYPRANEQAPVWTFDSTLAACVVISASYTISSSPGYNGVIMTMYNPNGTSSAPIVAQAWDNNPASPTYYLGTYGKRPQMVQSSNVTTTAQLQAQANNLLPSIAGATLTLTVTSMPLPWIEPFDVIQVNIPQVPIQGQYVVIGATVPLDYSGTLSLTLAAFLDPVTTYNPEAAVPPVLPYPVYAGSTYTKPTKYTSYTGSYATSAYSGSGSTNPTGSNLYLDTGTGQIVVG